MSRSNAITLDDLRLVFRILGDARALKHDKMQQEKVIVDGLCNLLSATMGWASGLSGAVPGEPTVLEHFVPGEVQDAAAMKAMAEWSRFNKLDEDPMVFFSAQSTKNADVCCRSRRLTTKAWVRWEVYEQVGVPLRAVDSLVLWFRYPKSDRTRGYALQRCGDEREFSDRDIAVARLFAEELYVLFKEQQLEPGNAVANLPKRLQRLLPYMLTEMSQKQIASKTGLSYHTVRSYTRELYDLIGVDSRQALITKLRGG